MRPNWFAVGSSDYAAKVIRKARNLRTMDGYSWIYISPDRTLEERRAYQQLIDQIKMTKVAEPNKLFAIKNNKIASFLRSEPVGAGNV